MFSTPSSGLSLIIHLVIIFVATVYRVFFGKFQTNGLYTFVNSNPVVLVYLNIAKRTIAALIIVSLTAAMVVLTGIAIRTGYREGSQEWHKQLIMNGFDRVKTEFPIAISASLDFLLAKKVTYERQRTLSGYVYDNSSNHSF